MATQTRTLMTGTVEGENGEKIVLRLVEERDRRIGDDIIHLRWLGPEGADTEVSADSPWGAIVAASHAWPETFSVDPDISRLVYLQHMAV